MARVFFRYSKPVPEILIQSVSKYPEWSETLIYNYLYYKKPVPEILLLSAAKKMLIVHRLIKKFEENDQPIPPILKNAKTLGGQGMKTHGII